MKDSAPITNLAEPLDESLGHGDTFACRFRRLGAVIGLEKLGCSVYAVAPGKRAFPRHAHSTIEELFVVLQGSGTLRHEGRDHPIRQGDVIAAPTGKAHQIVNTSDEELRYLAISTNESTDVVLYPDSNKVLAYSRVLPGAVRHMTRLADARDYYDGED